MLQILKRWLRGIDLITHLSGKNYVLINVNNFSSISPSMHRFELIHNGPMHFYNISSFEIYLRLYWFWWLLYHDRLVCTWIPFSPNCTCRRPCAPISCTQNISFLGPPSIGTISPRTHTESRGWAGIWIWEKGEKERVGGKR